MNNDPNKEFTESALKFLDEDIEFKPVATYDKDGDCVEFLITSENFYAERVDSLVTVYYSRETNEIVGSLIKGVSGYCQKLKKKMPGFSVVIHEISANSFLVFLR